MIFRFQPAPIDLLMKAFQALDPEGRGELKPEELRKMFSLQGGEPFSPDEMDDMLNAAVDTSTKTVVLKNFVHLLNIEDESF